MPRHARRLERTARVVRRWLSNFQLLCCLIFYLFHRRESWKKKVTALAYSNTSTVLVSYTYHESRYASPGEILRKRANLYAFLKHGYCMHPRIDYTFSVSGRVPSSIEFYSSLGRAQLQNNRIFPDNARVVTMTETVSDLCQHARVATEEEKHTFYVFLNDGTFGPVLRSPAQACSIESISHLPFWISKFLLKFDKDVPIAAVGASSSCEQAPHIPTNFIVLTEQSIHIATRRWNQTCNPHLSWLETIKLGEVQLTTELLRKGFQVKSIDTDSVLASERPTNASCKNPSMTYYRIYDKIMIKYGGEVWRKNLIHSSVRRQVEQLERSWN